MTDDTNFKMGEISVEKMSALSSDIASVINRHSLENPSGTPDFILGDLLTSVLASYNDAVQKRADWRGESVELPVVQKVLDSVADLVQAEEDKTHFSRLLSNIIEEQISYRQGYAKFLMSNPGFIATFGEDFVVEFGEMNLSQIDKGEFNELNEYRVNFSQDVRFYRRNFWEKIQEANASGLAEEVRDLQERLRIAREQGDDSIANSLVNSLDRRAQALAELGLRLKSDGSLESV